MERDPRPLGYLNVQTGQYRFKGQWLIRGPDFRRKVITLAIGVTIFCLGLTMALWRS